jgi:hypothetical protein
LVGPSEIVKNKKREIKSREKIKKEKTGYRRMKVEYKVEKKSTVNELSLFEKNIQNRKSSSRKKSKNEKSSIPREQWPFYYTLYYMLWMNNGLFVHFGSTNWYPRAENSISRPL